MEVCREKRGCEKGGEIQNIGRQKTEQKIMAFKSVPTLTYSTG